MEPILVDPRAIPQGDNCNLNLRVDLPSPDEVRAKADLPEKAKKGAYRPPPVKFPDLGLIVKWGKQVTITEGQCLWFLKWHLSEHVPVPKIHGWKTDGEQTFLYMELVQSRTLAEAWEDLSDEDKDNICHELQQMIRQWRRLKLKPTKSRSNPISTNLQTAYKWLGWGSEQRQPVSLSNINGGLLRGIMFEDSGCDPAGPFTSFKDFHDFFAKMAIRRRSTDRSDIADLAGPDDDAPAVFTHADLRHQQHLNIATWRRSATHRVHDRLTSGRLVPGAVGGAEGADGRLAGVGVEGEVRWADLRAGR